MVGRGASGACSRLEIHLQYRPRLFSCLITPCQLKLNNKIYASRAQRAAAADVVNFYAPFSRIRHIRLSLRPFRDWLSTSDEAGLYPPQFSLQFPEILLDCTIVTKAHSVELSKPCSENMLDRYIRVRRNPYRLSLIFYQERRLRHKRVEFVSDVAIGGENECKKCAAQTRET